MFLPSLFDFWYLYRKALVGSFYFLLDIRGYENQTLLLFLSAITFYCILHKTETIFIAILCNTFKLFKKKTLLNR